jgi:hypothetical protein
MLRPINGLITSSMPSAAVEAGGMLDGYVAAIVAGPVSISPLAQPLRPPIAANVEAHTGYT